MDGTKHLKPVVYGPIGGTHASFQQSRDCTLSHAVAVERVERAIVGVGLWVLGKVDAQAFVDRGGYALLGTIQILAFHPRFMVRLIEADPSALLAAPLKFAIVESPDGRVTVSWADQAAAFARYENTALAALGKELSLISETIVTNALDPRVA